MNDDCYSKIKVLFIYFFLQERDEINFESYCRIEHVLSGFWLHALKGRTLDTNS